MPPVAEKYLIVSLGSIGRRHLRNLRALKPDARIGVLRLHTQDTSGVLPDGADVQFSSIDAALAFAPAAAILAGPASTHLAIAEALVTARIPVLTEKPIAESMDGIDELVTSARTHGVPLLVGYNLRFLPSLQTVRRLLLEGIIGEIRLVRAEVGQYLPDWRPGQPYQTTVSAQQALGGGALLELSHEIDYLYWIFGLPSVVSARGGSFGALGIDVEDAVELTLEYESPSILVNVHLDFLQRTPSRTCKFIGQQGTLIWNGIADTVDVFQVSTGQWSRIDIASPADRNQMYIDELSYFLDARHASGAIASDGEQGRDVLRIVEAAKTSIRSNAAVNLSTYVKH